MAAVAKRNTFSASRLLLENTNVFSKLLGQAHVFGVRRKRPCLADEKQPCELKQNDGISYPTQVEFEYHHQRSRMIIWYGLYVYTTCDDKSINQCPVDKQQLEAFINLRLPFLTPPEEEQQVGFKNSKEFQEDQEELDSLLAIGNAFPINHTMQRVVNNTHNNGRIIEFVRCSDNKRLATISRSEALAAARAYLGD